MRSENQEATTALEERWRASEAYHDSDVTIPFRVERLSQSSDSAIHHIRRSHNVRTRMSVTNRLLGQLLQCQVVDDLAVLDNAIMPLPRQRT